MNQTSRLISLIRNFDGDIEIVWVRSALAELINLPFFQSGGFPDQIKIVQWCFRGLMNVTDRGRTEKEELLDLIGLAVHWEADAKKYSQEDPCRSLLLYNSAVVNSTVLKALVGDE